MNSKNSVTILENQTSAVSKSVLAQLCTNFSPEYAEATESCCRPSLKFICSQLVQVISVISLLPCLQLKILQLNALHNCHQHGDAENARHELAGHENGMATGVGVIQILFAS